MVSLSAPVFTLFHDRAQEPESSLGRQLVSDAPIRVSIQQPRVPNRHFAIDCIERQFSDPCK